MSEIKFTTNPIDKKKSTKGAGKIAVIAVIVFIAGIVLLIVGAVMLPIFSMYGNIEGSAEPETEIAYVEFIDTNADKYSEEMI